MNFDDTIAAYFLLIKYIYIYILYGDLSMQLNSHPRISQEYGYLLSGDTIVQLIGE